MTDIDPILRIGDVLAVTGLSRATLYRKMNAGDFPQRLRLGPGMVGWRQSHVVAWINSLSNAS